MRFNKSSPIPMLLPDGLTIESSPCVQRVLQQKSIKGGFASRWMDDLDGRLRAQIANDASLPFISHHVATMPAEHSGRFGTQISALDHLKAKVTLTRSAFGGGTTWNLR